MRQLTPIPIEPDSRETRNPPEKRYSGRKKEERANSLPEREQKNKIA